MYVKRNGVENKIKELTLRDAIRIVREIVTSRRKRLTKQDFAALWLILSAVKEYVPVSVQDSLTILYLDEGEEKKDDTYRLN